MTPADDPRPVDPPRVVVIGAGPAGLTAAYVLATRHGMASTVLESDDVVGGISRTVERDGWRFDLGGHRFFTKVKDVEKLWHEILPGDDFMVRPRMSRVYYRGKFYDYPLRALNALRNLGLIEAIRCVLSYVSARIRPPKDQTTLEGWIISRFGRRLFVHFFKSYNEKVWGVPVSKLPADFAAQRIKNLSLSNAVVNALLPKRNQKKITSLIEEFQYPKYGPGMMWERCRDLVQDQGSEVHLASRVVAIRHEGGQAVSVTAQRRDGVRELYACSAVISSMPISQLIFAMQPQPPEPVVRAAADLRYRDFMTVALVVPEAAGFPDNWIYINSPDVQVGRIQNFGAWSPYLVKEGRACLGLEFFVFEGDETWEKTDAELIAQGTHELGLLGLVDPRAVEAGYVVRMPKAYPLYDDRYKANVATITEWLDEHAPNVHPVGRNGMHRYNNQDHSMYTAMLAAENVATGSSHDVWSVNVEQAYHEQAGSESQSPAGAHGTGRDAPVIPRRHFGGAHPVNQPGGNGLAAADRLEAPTNTALSAESASARRPGSTMRCMPLVSNYARRRKLEFFLPKIPQDACILELGCADGWVGQYAVSHGWRNLIGIDLLDPGHEYSHKFIHGDINQWRELGLKAESFDAIIAFEVVEHGDFWDAIRDLLKQGGKLLVTTPVPHMDWACRLLELLGLNQARSSPHTHLTNLDQVTDLKLLDLRIKAGISQWAIFEKPQTQARVTQGLA